MSNLAEFIRAKKTKVDVGEWKNGHIPPSAFPLSGAKRKNYKFGSQYSWRLIKYDCLGYQCRVLMLMNEGKQIFRATLGIECSGDLVILCSHEFHADHPGWHCHISQGELKGIPSGVLRPANRRWPGSRVEHSRKEFNITRTSALSHVAARYGFQAQGDLI